MGGGSGRDEGFAAIVRYHYEGSWWADSPTFPEWSAFGRELDEVRLLAHSGLRFMGAASVIDPFGPPPSLTAGGHRA